MTQHPDPSRAPVVQAYGDEDDHLRIVVLLAGLLRSANPDAADECRRAMNNTWGNRLDALKEVLRSLPAQSSTAVVLDDPDSLAPGDRHPRTLWSSSRCETEREELLKVLAQAALRSEALRFSRPTPSRRTSVIIRDVQPTASALARLDGLQEEVEPGNGHPLGREIVRVADWLQSEGVFEREEMQELTGKNREVALLTAVWERLKPSARAAACRVSAHRQPLHLNGTAGPFPWSPAAPAAQPSPSALRRDAVQALLACGFLLKREGDHWQMPRPIRHFVEGHARWLDDAEVCETHRSLAESLRHRAPEDSAKIERHWHAVAGGDVDVALETAQFYGSDLRVLGTRLGQQARLSFRQGSVDQWHQMASKAADVFDRITTDFDPDDAYAWEYSAFNRWQPFRNDPASAPAHIYERVERGFTKACELSPLNPLFRGRLIAFHIATGREFEAEFNTWLARYSAKPGGNDQLSWYVEPVYFALVNRADFSLRWGRLATRWKILNKIEDHIKHRRRSEE